MSCEKINWRTQRIDVRFHWWDYIWGFLQNSPVFQAVVQKCWSCTLLQLPVSHSEPACPAVVCAATLLPHFLSSWSPRWRQQLRPSLPCDVTRQVAVVWPRGVTGWRWERPRPREAGAVVSSVSVPGTSCLQRQIFQFVHTSGFRECCRAPLVSAVSWAMKQERISKSSQGTVSSGVFTHFILAVHRPILGLGWGSSVWYSCDYYSCIFALHLLNQTMPVISQKAKNGGYTFSVCIQCSC